MKDRLIELLEIADNKVFEHIRDNDTMDYVPSRETIMNIMADTLLATGVIVLPVKVGRTVWCILNRTKPQKFQITIVTMSEKYYSFVIEAHKGVYKHYCDQDSVGRVVFFTEQEAEKALAERGKE